MIELYRAALALAMGDPAGTVRHAGRALELAPPQEYLAQASAAGLLGLAHGPVVTWKQVIRPTVRV